MGTVRIFKGVVGGFKTERVWNLGVSEQSDFYPGCDKSCIGYTEANSAYIFSKTHPYK